MLRMGSLHFQSNILLFLLHKAQIIWMLQITYLISMCFFELYIDAKYMK